MIIDYAALVAYINSLGNTGTLTKSELNKIIRFILNGGLTSVINTQKSNNGGIF